MKKKALLFTVCIAVLVVLALSITVFATANENSEPTLKIAKNSLELQNAVFMNFKVESSNIDNTSDICLLVWESAPAEYSKDTASATLSSLHTEEDTGYIVFQYDDLAAKDMTKQIYVCAYANVDGTDVYSKPVKFSIIQYAYNALNSDSSTQELKNLLTNMLSYGASAQIYFNHNTDFLATDTVAKIKVVNGIHADGFSIGYYKAGTSVTLTANASDEGYVFSHWEDSTGKNVGSGSTLTINECTSETYTAVYRGETAIESQGLAYSVNEDRTTCKITGIGTCKDTQLYIPSEIDGYRVTIIGDSAFYGCSGLTSITIPNSVTSIGDSAFYGCSSLTSITIENGCLSIGKYVFKNCILLKEVIIPNSVTTIGESVFAGCSGLEQLTLPFVGTTTLYEQYRPYYVLGVLFGQENYDGSTATKQYYDYYNSQAYNTYYIPDSLHSVTVNGGAIRFGAFYNCKNIKNITFGDNVTGVADDAFYNCSGLEAVHTTNIANWCGINFANEYAQPLYYADEFYVNGVLATDIVIPEGVTKIGIRAFYRCKTIESVKIPGTVTNFMNSAFEMCTSLRKVIIDEGVERIGSSAFTNCSNLSAVVLPSSITVIPDYAFRYDGFYIIYYKGNEVSWENLSRGSYIGTENAAVYYYTETQPTSEGKYWHYDENGIPAIWE